MQRNMSRTFLVLLALPATAMGFALSVQISALSWILSTRYGLDLHEIGLVWAAGPLAGIAGQVLIGILSDKVWFMNGRRRPFVLLGGLLSSAMLLALPNMSPISKALGLDAIMGVAITVAIALDLSINVSFNPARSLIADVTSEGAMRTRGYTWMQTVSGLCGVLAYAIGAVFGNDTLIYIGAVVVLLFSVVPSLLIEEPRHLAEPPAREGVVAGTAHGHDLSFRGLALLLLPLWGFLLYDLVAMGLRLKHVELAGAGLEAAAAVATLGLFAITLLARDRGVEFVKEDLVEFRKVLAAHSLSWIAMQTMFVYMIAFVQQRFPALDATGTGRVLSISFLVLNAVGALLPAFVLEPFARRYGPVGVHASCLAVMSAGFAGVYFAGYSPVAVYTMMAVLGVGWAAIVSLPFAIMSQRVEQARIGLYMGVFNLSVVLPQLLVSLGVGTLLGRIDDKGVMFLVGAVCTALSAVAWLFVRRHTPADIEPAAAPPAGH